MTPRKHSVIVDAGVIAVPDVGCTKCDAFRYEKMLRHWRKYSDESWVTIYIPDSLYVQGWYPIKSKLKELINEHDIIEFDVQTVTTVVHKFLSKAHSFEDCFRVQEVLSEDFEITPDVVSSTTRSDLIADFERCITLIAILRKRCFQPLVGYSLVVKNAPSQPIVQIRAKIHELDHSRDDIPALPHPPDTFESDVPVCENFHGLVDCLSEAEILVGASDDIEVQLAIRIALYKYAIKNNENLDWHDVVSPNLGSKFRKSCLQCCKDQGKSLPEKILRSIRETVKGQKLDDVHAIRINEGGNSPKRMRGLDRAQRRDIDSEFHLHYWEMSGGKIELASVVYHNDISIPE